MPLRQSRRAAFAALMLCTGQLTVYHAGDDGAYQKGIAKPVGSYAIKTTGSQSGTTAVDCAHYASNTISFSHGSRQAETATVVATITLAGNAVFTVTAANSPALAAGKAINVAVDLADTDILVAGKARTVLAADADVIAFFTVTGTGATVVLTARTAAVDDATMNLASADGTCAGITAAANSANTTAGDVTTHCIYDSAAGLDTVLTADTLRVRGSTLNDAVYTVATGGAASRIIVTESITDEAAGAYVSLYKRASLSNNTVVDLNTGLEWLRYTTGGPVLKVGPASNGKLCWYDATKCFTLHPAAADLAMVAGNILRIVGSDESTRYHAGDILVCAGFANAVNNLPGYPVVSVSFTGGNTDIVLNPLGLTLVAEAAAGSRSIKLVCRSVFGFCAAANAASLGGFTDWRMPNDIELKNLCDMEAPTAVPNATAFPSWPISDYFWSASTHPASAAYALVVSFYSGYVGSDAKSANYYCALVGG